MARLDLTGQRFGRVTALARAAASGGSNTRWRCLCDCGRRFTAQRGNLRRGVTLSCGCMRIEMQTIHGHASDGDTSRTYVSWRHMIARCTNPRNDSYIDYGGRGIKVCEHWRSFANFLADMGERPPGLTLDRFPNRDGNYEPGNCRWATPKEQIGNRRTRVQILRDRERVLICP